MALLKREEWQGFVRDVDWSYRYVDDEAVFPEWHSGTGKVPRDAWLAWEESYKVSYPEYVATQREKEAAVYAALQRSSDNLTEGWKSATKMHFGGVALVEYAAVLAELKMARFGLNGSWRNIGVMKNPVGPVLRMGDEVELIIAAIEDDNPDTDIEVIDRGAYVRVQGEDEIRVTEETLRRYLGADYEIRSFGGIMSAFSGRVITTSDAITWRSIALGKEAVR
jgi:hypothetical protein